MPEELFEEVLEAAVKHAAACGNSLSGEQKQHVMELFAGQAASGNAEKVLKEGMGCVPVDISTKYFSPDWKTINLNEE